MQTTGATKKAEMREGEIMIYAGRGAQWAVAELERRREERRQHVRDNKAA